MFVKDNDKIVAMFDVKMDPEFAFATMESSEAVEELRRIKRQIKLLKDLEEKFCNIIKKEMGEKETLVGEDGTIIATYKFNQGRADIDKKLLQEFYPDAYKDCLVKSNGYRSLLIK